MNLKQKLSKKLKKSGGFTLIEMLIVVAIIAILVAVSIPMVGSALEKARVATDQANERAAKGAAMVEYLTEGVTTDKTYYYDAEAGTVTSGTGTDAPTTAPTGYGQCSEHKDGYLQVKITAATDTTDMKVDVTWQGTTGGSETPHNIDGSIGDAETGT